MTTPCSAWPSSTCIGPPRKNYRREHNLSHVTPQLTRSRDMSRFGAGSFRWVAVVVAALVLVSSAAASPSRDMATALRALHYPKPGALKMGCRGATVFRCKATYRHHRVRRFQAKWAAMGGFICAGKTIAGCNILRHGFLSPTVVGTDPRGAAQQTARGYMTLHYQAPDPYIAPGCVQSTQPSTWSFCYWISDTAKINITVHLAKVKAGYVTTVTAAEY